MKLPGDPKWRNITIIVIACAATIMVWSLKDAGPAQGGSGTIMFHHTPLSCSFLMELQVGDVEFGRLDISMEADAAGHCVVTREAGDYHTTGRAAVYKSIEAAGKGLK